MLLGSTARGPMGMPAERAVRAVSSSKKYPDTMIALMFNEASSSMQLQLTRYTPLAQRAASALQFRDPFRCRG